jgi:aldose 1-epimerase
MVSSVHRADRVCALLTLALLGVASCTDGADQPEGTATVTRGPFGVTPAGDTVEVVTLTNRNGVEVRAMTYGAIIVSLRVPDRAGQLADVVLGFDSLDGYLEDSPYFGAIVGRYANRIANGKFTLDGTTYSLATNNGPNHLHGGVRGFDKIVWDAEPFENDSGAGVTFSTTSPDGDEGYPGTLSVRVSYTLLPSNQLVVDYYATTDRSTPINLSQHSYFNLAGDGERDVLEHRLTINASHYTPVDTTLIPTGAIASVEGTPFDFTDPNAIGSRIDGDHEQLLAGGGYDHNFVLDRDRTGLALAARVEEPATGRVLEIYTTEPGLQFYSGNFLDGSLTGKAQRIYRHRYGFCLETQHFPDSPNQPNFPSTILRPGDQYRSQTVFAFSTSESQ